MMTKEKRKKEKLNLKEHDHDYANSLSEPSPAPDNFVREFEELGEEDLNDISRQLDAVMEQMKSGKL